MVEAQLKVMEMERCELEVVAKRRCIMLDKATFLEKGIKILDLKRFLWI